MYCEKYIPCGEQERELPDTELFEQMCRFSFICKVQGRILEINGGKELAVLSGPNTVLEEKEY